MFEFGSKKTTRKGYMGHLTNIANLLLKLSQSQDDIKQHLDGIQEFDSYRTTILQRDNELNSRTLGAQVEKEPEFDVNRFSSYVNKDANDNTEEIDDDDHEEQTSSEDKKEEGKKEESGSDGNLNAKGDDDRNVIVDNWVTTPDQSRPCDEALTIDDLTVEPSNTEMVDEDSKTEGQMATTGKEEEGISQDYFSNNFWNSHIYKLEGLDLSDFD
mmetsp:Transcript_35039/g.39745  ORF Transcript_35039/g.39745 Transcript_35039/m.39745 type:complete len:214 (+) Transcript_35039:1-642(+)